MKLYKDHLMKEYSNIKIGGIAKEFIEVDTREELFDVLNTRDNIFILGNGTNTLLNDGYLDIAFVSLKNLDKIKDCGDEVVEVGAGLDFSKLIEYMEINNYSGLENLAGIPGSVGGLVFMNGGAYGTEIFDKIESVEIIDEKNILRKIKKENIKFSYRSTEIKQKKWIVVSVTFKFDKGYKKEIVEKHKMKRNENHPLNEPNLGSTFKNPDGFYSAKLIIQSGLQGKRIGGAEVSMIHPNFIVNKGNATFEDINNLIDLIKKTVKQKTEIELLEEIIIVKG